MKKLVLSACFTLAACAAFSQGLISFANGTYALISTNAIGTGGTSGPTAGGATNANSFYYALFTADLGTTNSDLTSGLWTFTGNYATNTTVTINVSAPGHPAGSYRVQAVP